jgi:prepilin-type N-terminal cleavage/methylation domain-containing protein
MRGGGKIMTKGRYTKGFTLVELLVVIAIIAILAGAMFLVINPAKLMAKTRDSRRIAELSSVNKAIANALADSKIEMTAGGVGENANDATVTTAGAGWVRFTIINASNGLGDYMPTLPRDPIRAATAGYFYRFASNGSGWELNAIMESPDSASYAINDGGPSVANGNTCAATMPAGTTCRYEIGTDLNIIP